MKAMVLHKYGEALRPEEVPMPQPGDGEVLLKVRYCGICGTDLKTVNGRLPGVIRLPHVPGHEIAEEIVSAGSQVHNVAAGDPGIVYMYVPCHDSELCRTGRENICVSIKRLGFEYDGAFSQYVKIPAYNFFPVSRSSPLE